VALRALAYQWPYQHRHWPRKRRPISDQKHGLSVTFRVGLSVTESSELRILRQPSTCRPISDRPKWLVRVCERTSFRPISDESSAYQMPIHRPIRGQAVGLSGTFDPQFPIKNTTFLPNSYPLTRARDLNTKLTILTQSPTQTASSKGGSAPLALQTHPNPPYPRKESPSGISNSHSPAAALRSAGKQEHA
jgi:hypothetical protein